jgi:ribosomal-protein-alanine N-acetyltransferase
LDLDSDRQRARQDLLKGGVRMRVMIRKPRLKDRDEFLLRSQESRRLHGSWVSAPDSKLAFRAYARQGQQPTQRSFLVCLRQTGAIVGVANLNEIVFGQFQSAYLGYYGFSPHEGQGLMSEGVSLAVTHAFRKLRIHRVEANIQPSNRASIALVERLQFRKEGLSRRYLKVAGRWRDHERWATIAEDWRPGTLSRPRRTG